MEKYNNWKLKFYTIWAGQAVSLITSAILQMAIIFYLTEKTGSAIVLSMASLVGFLPYAVFGPAIGVLVDRHDRKKIMIGADLIIAAAGAVLAIVALYMELPIWMVTKNSYQEMYVYDWRSPIASVFYRFMTGEAFYDAPCGRVTGELNLKRQYEIKTEYWNIF